MKKKLRLIILTVLCLCLIGGVTGCAVLDDTINEIKGNLVGNGYTIRTYDNYGSKVMTTTGDKINVQGIRLRRLLTVATDQLLRDTRCHP